MSIFELTLNGYDSNSSDTDHLIKWVSGDRYLIDKWLDRYRLNTIVKEIRCLEGSRTFEDGLDVLLCYTMPFLGMNCVIKNDGDLFQVTSSQFDVQEWFDEVRLIVQ